MDNESYTLRLSVRLLNGFQITGLEQGSHFDVGNVRVAVEQKGDYLILRAADFDSEDRAAEFLPKLKVGLWNLAIKHGLAFAPIEPPRTVTKAEDPDVAARALAEFSGESLDQPLKPVHGLSVEGGSTIFRSGENVRFAAVGIPDLHLAKQWPNMAASLISGIGHGAFPPREISEPLATAIDLYLSSFHESTVKARFLTLTMALEVLAPKYDRHPMATEVVDELHGSIQQRMSGDIDDDTRHALESLKAETNFKKKISITRQIKLLVLQEPSIPDGERESHASAVEEAYKLRGKLVHQGATDGAQLSIAYETTLHMVRLLLSSRLGLPIDDILRPAMTRPST